MFSAFAPHQYQFFEEAIAGWWWWWLLVCERSICFVELILYHLGKEGVTRLHTNLAKYLLRTMVQRERKKEEVM